MNQSLTSFVAESASPAGMFALPKATYQEMLKAHVQKTRDALAGNGPLSQCMTPPPNSYVPVMEDAVGRMFMLLDPPRDDHFTLTKLRDLDGRLEELTKNQGSNPPSEWSRNRFENLKALSKERSDLMAKLRPPPNPVAVPFALPLEPKADPGLLDSGGLLKLQDLPSAPGGVDSQWAKKFQDGIPGSAERAAKAQEFSTSSGKLAQIAGEQPDPASDEWGLDRFARVREAAATRNQTLAAPIAGDPLQDLSNPLWHRLAERENAFSEPLALARATELGRPVFGEDTGVESVADDMQSKDFLVDRSAGSFKSQRATALEQWGREHTQTPRKNYNDPLESARTTPSSSRGEGWGEGFSDRPASPADDFHQSFFDARRTQAQESVRSSESFKHVIPKEAPEIKDARQFAVRSSDLGTLPAGARADKLPVPPDPSAPAGVEEFLAMPHALDKESATALFAAQSSDPSEIQSLIQQMLAKKEATLSDRAAIVAMLDQVLGLQEPAS